MTVATAAGCSWSANLNASWMTIVSGASGSGPGTIALTVASNPEPSEREGAVSVADQVVRMTQRGREQTACTYRLTSGAQRFGPEGGHAVANVTTEARCSWEATSTAGWLTLSPTSGTGTANVTFTAAPWTGTTDRKAEIRVADQSLTIRQDPPVPGDCEYTVSPLEFTLHWHQTGGQVSVTTRRGCTWTVRAAEPWITVPGAADRDGDGTVQFTMQEYTGETTRRAPIEIRWPTPTAGQNVWINHEGCRYALSETTRTFTSAGGKATVDVFAGAVTPSCSLGCPWTVEASDDWIRITSGTPGSGDDTVFYEVLANETGKPRTGKLTMRDRTLTITQTP